jgi:rSAM/selenodomain-associated transferase 1
MNQLGVFAKYWQPGLVKTRLAATIGAEAASRLHREFLTTILARCGGLVERSVLAFTPPDRRDEFLRIAGDRWQVEPQSDGDLGQRMRAYFESAFSRGAQRVLLIGADSPDLPRAFIRQALSQLAQVPIVLGPADDGGYYLIGMRAPIPDVFSAIEWSSPAVWQQTIARLRTLGCDFAQLPAWYDVDDASTLLRLQVELAQCDQHEPPLMRLLKFVDPICEQLIQDGTNGPLT